MKVAKYIRVSKSIQNIDRQRDSGLIEYIDKVSGSISFDDREAGSRLLKDCERGLINEVVVSAIDRLGRNSFDIQEVLNKLYLMGVNVRVENLGINSMIDGKQNVIFKMICDVLSNVAQLERENLIERINQGVAKAKAKGVYTGRQQNTTESREQFLSKYKKAHIEVIKSGNYSLSKLTEITELSINTIRKIKSI